MANNGAEGFYYQCLNVGCVDKDGKQSEFFFEAHMKIHMKETHHAVVQLFRSDRVHVK